MFGRTRLPVDVVSPHALPHSAAVDHCEIVSCLKHDRCEVVHIAQENSQTEQAHQAWYYDSKAKGSLLTVESCLQIMVREERGKLQTNANPQFMKWHL